MTIGGRQSTVDDRRSIVDYRVGPVPAPVRSIAHAISARSFSVSARRPASIQPSTCFGLRAPTIAPVTAGAASAHATATAPTGDSWRAAIGRRAAAGGGVAWGLGVWEAGDREAQSAAATEGARGSG